MTYARLEGNTVAEYPVYEGDIRLQFKDTSFPVPFQPPEGYVPVAGVQQPEVTHLQSITEGAPELVNGIWTQVWAVSDATPDEIDQRTTSQAASVRADRNSRLSRSDWTQLPDSLADHEAWATYRQEMRDVTAQEGFPWDVEWPIEPDASTQGPNYRIFWDALTTSTVYASIREQSFVSLPMNTLATEFIALIGDAKAGRPNEAAIQQSMGAILSVGTFTEAQLAELGAALVAGNLDGIYALS
jgi:hypothetical protein